MIMECNWTIDETLEYAAGARAGRRGEPFNPYASDLWVEGFEDAAGRFIAATERAIKETEAREKRVATAGRHAVSALREIIAAAEMGSPERAINAADADITIGHLVKALAAARALIPADADSDHLRDIDAAIRLGRGE